MFIIKCFNDNKIISFIINISLFLKKICCAYIKYYVIDDMCNLAIIQCNA